MKHSYLKRLFVNSCVKSEFRKNKKLAGNTDVGSQQKQFTGLFFAAF